MTKILHTMEGYPVYKEAQDIGKIAVSVWIDGGLDREHAIVLCDLMSKLYSVAYRAGLDSANAKNKSTSAH